MALSNKINIARERQAARRGYLHGFKSRRELLTIAAVDPPSIAAGATGHVDVTVPGAVVSPRYRRVVMFPPAALEAGLLIVSTEPTVDGTVRITLKNTTQQTTAAVGVLTSTGVNVSNNDTVTIGGKVYTFKSVMTATEGEVKIGADAEASLVNLARAINGTGGTLGTDYEVAAANPDVSAVAATTTVTLTARHVGVTITTTEGAVTLSFGAVTMVPGAAIDGASRTWTARLFRM